MKLIKNTINKILLSKGDRTKKLVKNSGVMALSTFLNTLTRVGLIAILARIYTKDQFGIWVAITSATAVMGTSDFGIGNALRNKLAELHAKNKNEDARKYFLSVIYFFIIFTVAISIILFLFRNQIPYGLVFKTNNLLLKSQGTSILIAVTIIFLLSIPIGIGATMYFAYQEAAWVGFFNVVDGVSGLIIIGICAYCGQSIVTTSILFFIETLVVNSISTVYFMYRRKWGLGGFSLRLMFRRVWSLLALSFTFAVLQIAGAFIYNSVTLIATSTVSLADAAQLNLVQKLYTVGVTIYLSFYNPLWAGYADAIHKKEWLWIKKTLTKTIQITSGLFISSIIIFAFFGNFFLKLLAGNSYVSQNKLFISMGLWALFYSLYSMGVAFLSALGKIKVVTVFTGCLALFFFYSASHLSSKWGILGISCLSMAIYCSLTLITYWQSFYLTNKLKKQMA